MTFSELLSAAKSGDEQAVAKIDAMYKPLLVKTSMVDGSFDEDLYQELRLILLSCIEKFNLF